MPEPQACPRAKVEGFESGPAGPAAKSPSLMHGPKPFPKLKIHRPIKLIDEFQMSDFKLINYDPDPFIKASMSV